jgi:hypothetical protein
MAAVKTTGKSGHIALGQAHAGKQVVVDQVEPGVWMIKLGEFVPDSERWLFEERVSADLESRQEMLDLPGDQEPPKAASTRIAPA